MIGGVIAANIIMNVIYRYSGIVPTRLSPVTPARNSLAVPPSTDCRLPPSTKVSE